MRYRNDVDLAREFVKLLLIQAKAKGDPSTAERIANEMKRAGLCSDLVYKCASTLSWVELGMQWAGVGPRAADRPAFEAAVQKATVAIGTTFDSQFAGPLVGITTLVQSFFRSLRNISLTDMLLEYAMPVKPNVHFAVTTAVGAGNSAAEATWTPVTKVGFASEETTPSKALALVACSEDLLRMGGELAQNYLSAELRNAVALATDIVSVGILTAGLSPIASTGDARKDLRKALEAIDLSQWSKPCVFVSPTMLKEMANMGDDTNPPVFPDLMLPNGGTISGMPCAGIDALAGYAGFGSPASDLMIVADAAQIAGDAGTLDFLPSSEASILMNSAPSVTSPEDEPAGAELVSMFQTNSVALRLTRWFNLSRSRSTAVAVVKGCSYAVA